MSILMVFSSSIVVDDNLGCIKHMLKKVEHVILWTWLGVDLVKESLEGVSHVAR